jgi:hypothetical protein
MRHAKSQRSKERQRPLPLCGKHLSRNQFKTMLETATKLTIIKTIHTAIWLFFNLVIFYLLYAVIVNKIDIWVWICIGLIFLEGLILLVCKRTCPVTMIARKYSDSSKDNFDIFLPNWLARHNKTIYTVIVAIALIILVSRIFNS